MCRTGFRFPGTGTIPVCMFTMQNFVLEELAAEQSILTTRYQVPGTAQEVPGTVQAVGPCTCYRLRRHCDFEYTMRQKNSVMM